MNFPYITNQLYKNNERFRNLVDHIENMLESYTVEGIEDALELADEHYNEKHGE
jgi:hypothetical protein